MYLYDLCFMCLYDLCFMYLYDLCFMYLYDMCVFVYIQLITIECFLFHMLHILAVIQHSLGNTQPFNSADKKLVTVYPSVLSLIPVILVHFPENQIYIYDEMNHTTLFPTFLS